MQSLSQNTLDVALGDIESLTITLEINIMKLPTQQLDVKGREGYKLHRDRNVTWRTSGQGNVVSHVVTHDTVRAAKAVLGAISSAS